MKINLSYTLTFMVEIALGKKDLCWKKSKIVTQRNICETLRCVIILRLR